MHASLDTPVWCCDIVVIDGHDVPPELHRQGEPDPPAAVALKDVLREPPRGAAHVHELVGRKGVGPKGETCL